MSAAAPERVPAEEIARFFLSFVLAEPRPYAARRSARRHVRRLLARADSRCAALPCIHIAGSKGKGSTALYAESILSAAGVRAGTFTSPHLERWTERFRIAGAEASAPELLAAIEQIEPHARAAVHESPDDPPTFFDVLTATALVLFHRAEVEIGIIEAGIGARHDATRAVAAKVACITGIELEHTDKLGHRLEAIAAHKAGVIRPATPLVLGSLPGAAEAVIRRRAETLRAPLSRLGDRFAVSTVPAPPFGHRVAYEGDGLAFRTRIETPAAHLAQCAALAARCVQSLERLDREALAQSCRDGIAACRLPGRVELLRGSPPLIVDGAHTPGSAAGLARALESLAAKRWHVVLSMSKTEHLGDFLRALAGLAYRLTVTRAEPSRSVEAAALAAKVSALAPGIALRVIPDPELAVLTADRERRRDEGVCATGSVYMAGLARRVLRAKQPPRASPHRL